MYVFGTRNTMETTRPTLLIILFIYCFSGENYAQKCTPTYNVNNFTEQNPHQTNFLVLDVSTLCSGGTQYDIIGVDVTTEFEIKPVAQLYCKTGDADAHVSGNASPFANPWTVVVNVSDANGNFSLLTVLVRFESINDNPATITNMVIVNDLPENTTVGTKIGGCTLTDGDYPDDKFNTPHVKIESGNDDNVFAVDEKTCDIILIKPLSYVKKNIYSLVFKAFNDPTDTTGTSEKKTVNVKPVNVYPPKCSPSNIIVAVLENTTLNTVLGKFNCTTYDGNTNVKYFRGAASAIPYLDVKETTGEVFLNASVQYDNTGVNNQKQIIVDVVPPGASDPKTEVTCLIYVQDVDNNVPQFTANLFQNTISASVTNGTSVLRVAATDADAPNTFNSQITYGLVSPCTPDSMSLDNRTGVMYFNGTSRASVINCKVYAFSSDKYASKSFADVNITVTAFNNNPPVFSLNVFQGNVTENSNVTTFVLNVNATDPENDTLTYTFPPGKMGSYWPFQIFPLSGEVSVANLINFEDTKDYFGPVKVMDNGNPPLDATAIVAIKVIPVNEYTPELTGPRSAVVNIFAQPGTKVIQLSANDGDDGDDGEFEFLLDNPNVPFVLDSVTGIITVGIGLNQATGTSQNLTVTVVDKSKTKMLSSKESITIFYNIVKENNNDPICNPLGPLLVAPNHPPVGDPIGYLNCYDAESGTGLKYDIIQGNTNMFTVVTYNGTIRLANTKPIAGSYILLFSVNDQGSPARVAFVSVQINVETLLAFTNLPATVSVYENSNSTDAFFTVNAEGSFQLITYAITGGNREGKFHVHQTNGSVRFVNPADREVTDSYSIQITARTADAQSVTQILGVSILDRNDNKPRYNNSMASLRISEKMAAPSTIAQYIAFDRDISKNAEIDYSIKSGNDNTMFKYTVNGTFQLLKQLDYEKQTFYPLILCATDKGDPPLTDTMILNVYVDDEDDNFLKIVSLGGTISLSLPEDVAVGAPVVRIQVQNNDTSSDLTFTITSGNNLTIDEKTGVVTLIFVLDRERAPYLMVEIRVTNSKGKSDTTILNITITDVNDNDPVFIPDNYVFSVPHGTSAESTIGTLTVTDSDAGVNKDLSLSITSGDHNSMFRLSDKTLIAAKLLDANVYNHYELQITAWDHGTPSRNSTVDVTVLVGPECKAPLFVIKTRSISLPETETPGSLIDDVDASYLGAKEASYPNKSDLIYILTSGDINTFFVEQDIGEVQLTGALNFTVTKSYTLIITAFNKCNRSKSDNYTLYITVTQVNMYSPVFSKEMYLWDVSETAPVNTAVGQALATDRDPGDFGRVSYSMELNIVFNINSSTAVVSLVETLEYSKTKIYCFQVKATDNAGSNSKIAICTICIRVIDVNNHNPLFINSPYNVTVPESLPVGSVVLTVVAEDLDSGVFGTVSYTLISGNADRKFALNVKTGAMTLNSSLDFKDAALYVFTIQAKDGGTPPLINTTTMTVHVSDDNDYAPVFGQASSDVSIPSDTPLLTSIWQGVASDADSGTNGVVSYLIESGNDDHLFSIHPVSGVLTVTTSLLSAGSFHQLTVVAVDHGVPSLTGTTIVAIVIQPAQQSPAPANFAFSIKENEAADTLVGIFPRDTQLINITSYTIRLGNIDTAFAIFKDASNNGILRTKKPLDRETYGNYRLTITASAVYGGLKYIIANIKVIDDNDNAPVFNPSKIKVPVVENLPAGFSVCTLTATDADENGVNNEVDMFISPYNPPVSTYFYLEAPATLKLKRPISFEDISSFEISIVASDRGTPRRSSTATVYVWVVNVTETITNKTFKTAYFKDFDIPDDAVEGDHVGQLISADYGQTLNPGDTVTYTTVGDKSVFDCNPSTGDLEVKRDSFITPSTCYFQSVIATVTSGGISTSCVIVVRIDTFNKVLNMISVEVDTYLADLNTQKDDLQRNLQGAFPPPQNVVIWQTSSTDSDVGRRRLLASKSVAYVVVEADKTVNNMANMTRAKKFLSSKDAAKALQLSDDGTPISSVANGPPSVASVKPYYTEDNSLDPAYIALIVVGSLVALAIIAALIALIIYCACYRRKKGSERKRLVEKKEKSKRAFGDLNKSKSQHVQSEPGVITNNLHDPDADGMPVKPTKALFISSSNVDSNPWPQKNSSTMLESLEERMEENYNDGASTA